MATATKDKKQQTQQPHGEHQSTIAALQKAYSMEMETVANYLADSVNLDGVRAEEIKKSLAEDVQEELGHAQKLAQRIKQLGGRIPGPTELDITHSHLEPTDATTNVERVIRGVIEVSRRPSTTTAGLFATPTAKTTLLRTSASRCWPMKRNT